MWAFNRMGVPDGPPQGDSFPVRAPDGRVMGARWAPRVDSACTGVAGAGVGSVILGMRNHATRRQVTEVKRSRP